MAYNFANPNAPMPEAQVIEYAKEQRYFTEFRWPFTSPASMLAIAGYYAPGLRTGFVSTQEQGLAVLVDQLGEGEPVIIDVPLRLEDSNSVAHFILVTGISRDTEGVGDILIHYNDPWTGEGLVAPWDGDRGIWQGWKDNNDPGGPGWWLAIPPP
jgi:hypothetical protein